VAKGHLVREVDALGGVMGEVADAVGIQFRLLNSSRGPAVWSPRAQCDKQLYRVRMREVLEGQPGLHIRQAEVVGLLLENSCLPEGEPENSPGWNPGSMVPPDLSRPVGPGRNATDMRPKRRVLGVKLRDGRELLAGATIITTGTFLRAIRQGAAASRPLFCWARRSGRWDCGRAG
jgi:tRNA uridine 5-carboxymethylaminomethyl modification enzyme